MQCSIYSMKNNEKGLDKRWFYTKFVLFLYLFSIKSIMLTKNVYGTHFLYRLSPLVIKSPYLSC